MALFSGPAQGCTIGFISGQRIRTVFQQQLDGVVDIVEMEGHGHSLGDGPGQPTGGRPGGLT